MSQYKIGQLAKMMGVSTHLLKHYEKFGIVVPIVDDSTNYRYYDISQCSRIIESKKYRNIGFSLNEIADLMNENSNEEMNQKVNKQIAALEAQIKELEVQKNMATAYLQGSREMDQKLNQWFIEYCPDYLFLIQTYEINMNEEGQCSTKVCNFLDQVPLAQSAIYIYADSLKKESLQYHWGIAKRAEDMDTEILDEHSFLFLKSCRCFTTYFAIEAPYVNNGRFIEQIEKQYGQFGGSITKDIFAIRFKIVHEGFKEMHYFQVYIPLT